MSVPSARFKKGHNVVTPWQRRWFFIADGGLWYYRENKETTKEASAKGKEGGKGKEARKEAKKDGGKATSKHDNSAPAAAVKARLDLI